MRLGAQSSVFTCPVRLPDDIWPLIWQHLSSKDLLFASHVCRTWRIDSLEVSCLWARLTLYAYESNADTDRPDSVNTLSNIGLLRHLFPRSKLLPLSLDADVAALSPSDDFYDELGEFLRLVAPRVVALRMFTADPTFAGKTFCEYDTVYPVLGVLDLSSSVSDEPSWFNSTWEVGFIGDKLPKLVSFALHQDYRVQCVSTWANLRSLTCTVNTILDIEPLLLTANRLQCLRCQCLPDNRFEPEDEPQLSWPNAPLLAALSAIPNVDLTALFEPTNVELAFLFFASASRPRLTLDFICKEYHGPLRLQSCSQLSTATRLSVSSRDDCIIIMPQDGSGRIMRLSLKDVRPGGPSPPIDWELVPELSALTHLCVDAALWPAVMRNFPSAPLLSMVSLHIRQIGDIDSLIGNDSLCPVPLRAAVKLVSEAPILAAITGDQVDALKMVLSVPCVSMDMGVGEAPGTIQPRRVHSILVQ